MEKITKRKRGRPRNSGKYDIRVTVRLNRKMASRLDALANRVEMEHGIQMKRSDSIRSGVKSAVDNYLHKLFSDYPLTDEYSKDIDGTLIYSEDIVDVAMMPPRQISSLVLESHVGYDCLDFNLPTKECRHLWILLDTGEEDEPKWYQSTFHHTPNNLRF